MKELLRALNSLLDRVAEIQLAIENTRRVAPESVKATQGVLQLPAG
jgi:hypothetical protein